MQRLSAHDVRQVVDVFSESDTVAGPEPFPAPVLEGLARVIPSGNVAYFEWDAGRLLAYDQIGFDIPPDVEAAWGAFGHESPSNVRRLRATDGAVRLSARISKRELARLDFYRHAMRPLGIEDELKLRLPTGGEQVAGFSFLRNGRFTERDRVVLDVLAAYLARLRERAARSPRVARPDADLTEREWEVLRWVAAGKTNKEIGALLLISADTIRTHLQNAFTKLGVHTRTAAVAKAFPGRRG